MELQGRNEDIARCLISGCEKTVAGGGDTPSIGAFQAERGDEEEDDCNLLSRDKDTAESSGCTFTPFSPPNAALRSSRGGWGGVGGGWGSAVVLQRWLIRDMHNQSHLTARRSPVSGTAVHNRIQISSAATYNERGGNEGGRQQNNDHMLASAQRPGDRLVNISLEPGLNSSQTKTYIHPRK